APGDGGVPDPEGRRDLRQADDPLGECQDVRVRADEGAHPERRILLLSGRGGGGRRRVAEDDDENACLDGGRGIAAAGCGVPPNQTLLTRTSTYMRAMSYGNGTGFPLDIPELERRFPELKGIVISAPQ